MVALTSLAQAQAAFKVTTIPDESPTELARRASPLVKYLEKTLGMKVEFTPVTDYAASVEVLANKHVDLDWYGGFIFVQANIDPDKNFKRVAYSGAHDATLLLLIACALQPSAGSLLLDGKDLWALQRGALQTLRGALFLAPQVPPLPSRQRVVTAVLAGRLPHESRWIFHGWTVRSPLTCTPPR